MCVDPIKNKKKTFSIPIAPPPTTKNKRICFYFVSTLVSIETKAQSFDFERSIFIHI